MGAKKQPLYRVVIVDEKAPRSGREIEVVGHYDPTREPTIFEVEKEKVLEWLKKGAQPTEKVRKLLGELGILPKVDYSGKPKRKPKKEEPAKEEKVEGKKEEKKEEAKAPPETEEKKEESKA